MVDEWALPETCDDLAWRWAEFSVKNGFLQGVKIPKKGKALEDFINRERLALRRMYGAQLTTLGVIATKALRQYKTNGYEVALQYFEASVAEDVYQTALFLKHLPNAHFLKELINHNKNDADKFKALLELLVDFGR